MRSHLCHFHKMKPGALLETSLRLARNYRGSKEAELLQPRPGILASCGAGARSTASATCTTTSTCTSLSVPSCTPASSSSTHTISGTPPAASSSSTHTISATLPAANTSTGPPSPSLPDSNPSDPDYQQQVDNRSYFTASNPVDDHQRWLVGFYKYLNNPDCGRKMSNDHLQHAGQPRKILEDLDPNGGDLNILSEDEGYKVWMDWVDPKMDDLSCGTIKSYLCTYEIFLTYVAMERIRPGQVPE